MLDWLYRVWIVRVEHVKSERNRVADCLAGIGLGLSSDLSIWPEPRPTVRLILLEDAMGAWVPRGF